MRKGWLGSAVSSAPHSSPAAGGVNRGPARYVPADQRDRSALAQHDEWQCATKDLANDRDDLALADAGRRPTPPRSKTVTGPGWSSTRSAEAS